MSPLNSHINLLSLRKVWIWLHRFQLWDECREKWKVLLLSLGFFIVFSNNKIQSIDPGAFPSPCAIKTFDISHNLLTSFDPSLFPNLALVGQLTLSNNLLTSIASGGTNTQITNLDLSYNRLTMLTNTFMKTLPVCMFVGYLSSRYITAIGKNNYNVNISLNNYNVNNLIYL